MVECSNLILFYGAHDHMSIFPLFFQKVLEALPIRLDREIVVIVDYDTPPFLQHTALHGLPDGVRATQLHKLSLPRGAKCLVVATTRHVAVWDLLEGRLRNLNCTWKMEFGMDRWMLGKVK